MEENFMMFIVIMTAIITVGALLMGLIRNRRPVAPGKDAVEAGREMALLSSENAGLKAQVTRLEDRLAVLERIATDPAARTAREIEELR